MATAAGELFRFHLPTRIRTKQAPVDNISPRLELADRIAGLPGIQTVEDNSATLPCCVDVYLGAPAVSLRKQRPAMLLCRISHDGVAVHGLSDRDRHQVLSRGWGWLKENRVVLFLPRDSEDLEVCWEIVQHAYYSLIEFSRQARPVRIATWPNGLPRVSRTSLQ